MRNSSRKPLARGKVTTDDWSESALQNEHATMVELFSLHEALQSYSEVINSENCAKWRKAMNSETVSLNENETWDPVDLPGARGRFLASGFFGSKKPTIEKSNVSHATIRSILSHRSYPQ